MASDLKAKDPQLSWAQRYWWVFLVVGIVIVVLGLGFRTIGFGSSAQKLSSGEMAYDSYGGNRAMGFYPTPTSDFAPEVEERQLIKTANLGMETKRGHFFEVQSRVNTAVKASGAYILSENFQTIGEGRLTYNVDNYQIKIETSKYDAVVEQLKAIGGVTSFTESATDVTGAITNTNVEIAAEKERLRRYEALKDRSGSLEDQILLTDRIFEQDRRIKYLEASLESTTQEVAYSTIGLRIQEKEPTLFGVAFAGIGSLIKTLVASFNGLLYFLAVIVPWCILAGLVLLVIRWYRRRK